MPHDAHEPDPAVVQAVEHIRDRFGVTGLRDVLALAERELRVAEAALAELAREAEPDAPGR
jgi:hypothetical protein